MAIFFVGVRWQPRIIYVAVKTKFLAFSPNLRHFITFVCLHSYGHDKVNITFQRFVQFITICIKSLITSLSQFIPPSFLARCWSPLTRRLHLCSLGTHHTRCMGTSLIGVWGDLCHPMYQAGQVSHGRRPYMYKGTYLGSPSLNAGFIVNAIYHFIVLPLTLFNIDTSLAFSRC